jgi:uncharacterized protein (TIGR00255 family)
MLLSMTGFGESRWQSEQLQVAVELRAVNNRYFKLCLRCAEPYAILESEIEKRIRQKLRRGTVTVGLQVRRQTGLGAYRLNSAVVRSYLQQWRDLEREFGVPNGPPPALVLSLPGVIEVADDQGQQLAAEDWPYIAPVLDAAVEDLQRMRAEEGRHMEQELHRQIDALEAELTAIEARVPHVVAAYRDRLEDRLQQLLAERRLELDPASLVREVALFAERSDVREEVVRLRSHLHQMRAICAERECPGRKLDFVIQEMYREVNTIGSKGNDVTIAQHVVSMKSGIEQMRELVQNVE